MKTKIIVLGAGVLALTGGLMFCGENAFFEDEEPDTITNQFNNVDAPTDQPFELSIDLAQAGTTVPVFWAVRVGEAWERPKPTDDKLKLTLDRADAPYAVVAVCESPDAKGANHVRTTLIEATGRELPAPMVGCAPTLADENMQLSGAIRNVDGKPAVLSIGGRNEIVTNPKGAKDVLFGTTAPAGKQTIAASSGGGEKTRVALARDVQVGEGTTVEIDMNDGNALQPHTMSLWTDGATRAAGGSVSLWIDGRTRIAAGALETWADGDASLGARSTKNAADYLDLAVAFRGPALPTIEFAPIARARFMSRANAERLTLPELTWVGPSHAYITRERMEFSWSTRNWAVFGKNGDEIALFAPVAYVANVHYANTATHDLNIVVTPNRVRGKTPHYEVPNLAKIDGWDGRWGFPAGQSVDATSGNLSAYAGDEAPNPGAAIAAYVDREHKIGPAQLGVNDNLTVVVAGSPVSIVKPERILSEVLQNRCFEQRPCSAKIKDDIMAVEMCPDTAAYNDCQEDPADKWNTSKTEFVRDLRHEILTWYQSGAEIPNARPQNEALSNVTEEQVHVVTDRTADEWWTYDPTVYQVFWHPDPTRESSATVWYGAYLAGRLVSIYPVNWDAKMPDGDVEYCRLRFQSMRSVSGAPSNPILATVHAAGLTEGRGRGQGIEMQLGWGSDTSEGAHERYEFGPMTYNGDVDRYAIGVKTDDQYVGTVTIDEVGVHHYVARVRRDGAAGWTYCDLDGSHNGISAEQLGTIDVRQTGEVVDGCELSVPQLVEDAAPRHAITIRAHVREKGMTGSQTMDTSMVGQLLVGAPGANPAESLDGFMSVPARPTANMQLEDGTDEYLAAFAPPKHATYAFAYRFSADGGANWTTCGLQDHEQPSGTFAPEKMGAIVASLPANFVDHCVVTEAELSDDASPDTVPTVTVALNEQGVTINDGGAQASQIQVQAAALPLEHNPALANVAWQTLTYSGEQPEKYEYSGAPYTADGQPDAGTYNVVVRVRRAGSSYWRYCDADPENTRFRLDTASRLTVTP